jgi:hypothetical protein
MPKVFLDFVQYAVRSSGLVLVIFVAAFFVASPLIATKASMWGVAGGTWVLLAAFLSWPRLPDAWRKDPPTAKQIQYAESLGLVVPEGASKGQVSEMISSATGR